MLAAKTMITKHFIKKNAKEGVNWVILLGTLVRLLLSGTEEKLSLKPVMNWLLAGRESKLGPLSCPLEKVRGRYRWQIVVLDNDLSPLLLRIKSSQFIRQFFSFLRSTPVYRR